MISLSRLALALSIMSQPATAWAIDFLVDDFSDIGDATPGDGRCAAPSGTCTLRAAVEEAVHTPDRARIRFAAAGRIELSSSLTLSSPVDIFGNNLVTLSRAAEAKAFRLFLVRASAADVVVDGLILEFGKSPESGGCVFVKAESSLILRKSTVRHCQTDKDGGGIASEGRLILNDVAVIDNVAKGSGGGILARGSTTIADVTIARNRAGKGGGIVTEGGAASDISSTVIARNVASKGGAAFFRSQVVVRNTLIVDNVADRRAGGIEGNPKTQLTMENVALVGNTLANGLASNCSLIAPFQALGVNLVGPTLAADGDKTRHDCEAESDGGVAYGTDTSPIDTYFTSTTLVVEQRVHKGAAVGLVFGGHVQWLAAPSTESAIQPDWPLIEVGAPMPAPVAQPEPPTDSTNLRALGAIFIFLVIAALFLAFRPAKDTRRRD